MKQKLYDFFVQKNSFFCYVLTICIASLLIFLWKTFIYSAEQKNILQHQAEIATLRKHARMISKLTGDEAKEEVMNEATIHPSIATSYDINQAIDFFLKKTTDVGLRIKNCVSQGEKKKDLYSVRPMLFKVSGTFEAISSFFEHVSSSKYLVRCGPLHMEKNAHHQINMQCILNFYQFNQDS